MGLLSVLLESIAEFGDIKGHVLLRSKKADRDASARGSCQLEIGERPSPERRLEIAEWNEITRDISE